MIWFGEEAEALLKQFEKLFKRIVVRIVAFQNDWDRCDPIWRFCWQNRRGRWYETRYAGHNGALESIWLSDIGSRYATLKEFVRWKPLPMLRPREHRYNPIINERI